MAAKELVNDMKLNAEIHPDGTTHYTFEPDYSQDKADRWLPKKEIWKKEKLLGEGTYGKVWLERCSSREGPARLRAVKMIIKPTNSAHRAYCDQELEAIAKFSQQKYTGLFVKSSGWFENEESIFIAMEHIELGDLDIHLKGPLPEIEARQISYQILQGLQHLHDNGFVHRDLKPRSLNVFIMSTSPHWWVKIGDFGFSKRHTEGVALQSMVGTLLFLAPEVLKLYPPGLGRKRIRSDYTHTADIWSLGVMTFYMLCHDYPFPDYHSLWSYVQSSDLPSATKLKSVSESARELTNSLLVVDATVRLSAKEALQSRWLKQDSFDPVSGMASLAISEESMPRKSASPLARNINATVSDASKGWDEVEKSSVIVDEEPIRIALETEIKQACSHSRTPMEHDPLAEQRSTLSATLLELQAMRENGVSLIDLEMFSEAETICRQAWEGYKQALGEKHINTLASQFNLGTAVLAC
ncbi:hypothetical protein AFLA_013873 [Aspergillus flavus NRRL3357]|nr:hypothetical protein AFLA_013873 [Aspergillus flavus NRRL3357]RAQ57532.1 hypothetical protein COH21_010066 [Aspergillus flavus]